MTESVSPAQLTREQVCSAIGCSSRKLSYMLANNQFPPGVRLGRHDYWQPKALERWRQTLFDRQENWRPIMNLVD